MFRLTVLEMDLGVLERVNKYRGRQVGLVGRRCPAAEAAQQRGPTVYPATVFFEPL